MPETTMTPWGPVPAGTRSTNLAGRLTSPLRDLGSAIAGSDFLWGTDYTPGQGFEIEDRAGLERQYQALGEAAGDVASGRRAGPREMAAQRALAQGSALTRSAAAGARGYGAGAARQAGMRRLGTLAQAGAGQSAQAAAGDVEAARQQQMAALGEIARLRMAEMQARIAREGFLASQAAQDQGVAGQLITAGASLAPYLI